MHAMNSRSQTISTVIDPSAWQQAMYAFLAEGSGGPVRAVRSKATAGCSSTSSASCLFRRTEWPAREVESSSYYPP